MIILALDQATQSGFAVGTADSFDLEKVAKGEATSVESGIFRMPKREVLAERLQWFRDGLFERIDFYKPDLISFEEPYWPPPPQLGGVSNLEERLEAALADTKKIMIILEAVRAAKAKGPRIPINNETLRFLQKVEAIVILAAADRNLPTEHYRSNTWRKTALGMGFAPHGSPLGELKRMMKAKAPKLVGYPVETEDEADAIGILYHAACGPAASARAQGNLLEALEKRRRN